MKPRLALVFALLGILAWTRGALAQSCPTSPSLELVVGSLSSPLFVGNAGDATNRLFIVERGGRIKVLQPGSSTPTVFLNISGKVLAGGEQGLLGLAFHPSYATNGRFFVDYTRSGDGATVIAEYHVSAADANVADSAEIVHLTIAQPFSNHNGGMIEFGPDGYLCIAMGDGGDANDPGNRAQNVNDLLGKILRIDVDTPNGSIPYSSPATNPFFGATPGADEIYAVGMRNPFRFSFDRGSGQLYVGDVGQGAREEIDIVTLGGNYGWRVMEGTRCNISGDALPCDDPSFTPPIAEYSHSGGRCSITGGYVYRGALGNMPTGAYVYGDFCTGEIFFLQSGAQRLLVDTSLSISSFGEDEAGELYVVNLGSGSNGTVSRIHGGVLLDPTSASFGSSAGSGSVALTAPTTCSWSAAANDAWLGITSSTSGTGNATVNYSVAANAGPTPRSGSLTIAGAPFGVSQSQNVTPSASVGDLSITEGNSGTAAATFLVTLSGPSSQTVTVDCATTNGSAVSGADYVAESTTVTFAPQQTSQPVTVSVKGDTKDEPDETFSLDLSNPSGATLGDSHAVGTIVDNDPLPSLTIGNVTTTEGGGSDHNVSFAVTLSPASGRTVTVGFATADNSASAGSDYTAKSGTLTFTAGQTSKSIAIQVKGDFADESDESFFVNLQAPTNATLADGQGLGTIQDDDNASPPVSVSIGDATVLEGNTGTTSAVFNVTLSAASAQGVTVSYATAAGSATSADFTAKTGTLTFDPGHTAKTVTIAVKGDFRDEPNESFLVNLTSAGGATIADGQGIGTIQDDDAQPTLSIGNAQVSEGDTGMKNITFTLALSQASGFTVSVNAQTAPDSAQAPADFTGKNAVVTFTPGQLSKTFVVSVKGDTLAEATESFFVNLSGALNATILDGQATGTILDND